MDRKEKILANVDIKNSKGLEIGPLRNPLVSKSDGEVFYLDHLSTADLRLKYKNHNFNIEEIVDVDYVLKPELSLKQIVGENNYFDYVVASHVFEHIPNPVKWMQEIWEILAIDGKLVLAIPDKRFCFDYFRSLTSSGDIIQAYLNNDNKPSVKAVFDNVNNAVEYQGIIAWGKYVNPELLQKKHTVEQAFELAKSVAYKGAYHDVHSWCFIPQSFLAIIRELIQLKLLQFSVSYFHDTVGIEFYITLKKAERDIDTKILLASIPSLLNEEVSIPRDFNSKVYLKLNPDVEKANVDPVQHFIKHGRGENRKYK